MPLSGSPGNAVVPGIIRAFDAETLDEIWNSQEVSSRDSVGTYAKFVPPLVVNGKVYMATFNNAVVVYGLLPEDARELPKRKLAAREEIRNSGKSNQN
jgi:outer membrane protein assembly factor BamB